MTDEHFLKHKELDGRAIAAGIHEECRKAVKTLTEGGWAPRLVSVVIGDVDAVEIYVATSAGPPRSSASRSRSATFPPTSPRRRCRRRSRR